MVVHKIFFLLSSKCVEFCMLCMALASILEKDNFLCMHYFVVITVIRDNKRISCDHKTHKLRDKLYRKINIGRNWVHETN